MTVAFESGPSSQQPTVADRPRGGREPIEGDGGMMLAFAFASLVVTGAVVVVALSSSWWAVALAVAVNLCATVAVSLLIARLLADDGGDAYA